MTGEVRQDINELADAVPTWAYVSVSFLFGVSTLYSLFLDRRSLWVSFWVGVTQVALSLFVIYLFYRLVLAVERIAD